MKAFIFTGGVIHPEYITEHPTGDDIVIAADSGYQNARATGTQVSILCGDFDSFTAREGKPPEDTLPASVEIIRVPAEKDATDTQLAVSLALDKGADEIVIIGGLGGRLDHTLSNLGILEHLAEKNIYATILDGQSRARYVNATCYLIARSPYRYLSIIAADKVVKGVSVDGCKYPLKNARLCRGFQYAVSNEITGNCALISVKKGGIFLIESRDV